MDVLAVDDEALSRLAIALTLSTAGYRVVTVGDGHEALRALKEGPHQIVISDWSMPRMNGIELCRAVRNANLRRYVYIIMLSGHNRSQDTIEGLRAGADDYVTKPFNPAELIMRVNTARRIIELETRGMTVFAMAKLAESRDSETGAHLERVREYSRILAQRLRQKPKFRDVIDDEYVRLIYETSPLHDIGKVAIPDAILLKPGKLTPDEFAVMQMHTVRGAETLDAALLEFPNARFLRIAKEIALSHHEKYDGSGYPAGLRGDGIPLSGRIVAVADVYDALTSKRIYKPVLSHETAVSSIVNEAGRHFDPDLVETFLESADEFRRCKGLHSEAIRVAGCPESTAKASKSRVEIADACRQASQERTKEDLTLADARLE